MNFEQARHRMVMDQLQGRGIRDPRVLAAMEKVPRHLFVEEALWNRAYGDHALPIGEKQTISQPYMVAAMTEILSPQPQEKILEIGTGSGYQTAVLAELCAKVYSIERIKALAHKARALLDRLGYQNIVIKHFDGTYGWKECSPFDGILVTAGSPDIPQGLLDQLGPRGRLVIPVGERKSQVLKKIAKTDRGITTETLTPCVFVPLIGTFGWKKEGENGETRFP